MKIDIEKDELNVILAGLNALNQQGQPIEGSMQIIGLSRKLAKHLEKKEPIKSSEPKSKKKK